MRIVYRFGLILLINISFFTAVSAEFSSNRDLKAVSSNITDYKIFVPGKLNNDGSHRAANIYTIKKVAPEHYLQNVIHIKTKSQVSHDKNGTVAFPQVLTQSLSKFNLKKVRNLIPQNNYSNLLANDEFGIDRIYEINYSDAIDPYDVCIELMENPEIEYACPVFIRHTFDYTPNDPDISKQWAITNMAMKKAWDLSKGDKSVKIAIVDCGTDWKHQDLIDNIWTNPNEIDGNKIDDDNSGKIDDIRGWDFIGNITFNDVAMGNFREDNDPTNYGNGYHGTHVAGCASAVTNNSKGLAGIGFNCSLIPIKCSIDNNQQAILRAYEAVAYAANLGADIINCSWGGPGYSPAEQDIINAAVKKGSLVVVAAGNDNRQNIDEEPTYPSSYNNVLCVGATMSNDKPAGFTNIGWLVTVYSPGQGIYSTMPGNAYGNLDGTSMATPNTAGLAGLIKTLHKNWEPKQILHQIRSTSDNVVTTDATQRPYFYGRSNAYNALDYNNNNSRNIPGVEITNVNFQSGDALTSFNPQQISLKVKNYLATASDLKVKIKSQGNALSVSSTQLSVGELKNLEEKDFNLTVQLTNLNPWFVGYVNLQITFESGNYTDYQLVRIPVRLSTKNSYNTFYTFKDGYDPSEWTQAIAVTENYIWACGNSGASFGWKGGVLRIVSASPQMGPISASNEGIYCVHAFDINRAYFGSGTSNDSKATVYSTYDGGGSWMSKDVSTITGFINAIYFFNDLNGIILGDPKNGKYGIATTADSGNTWTAISNSPVPLKNETGRAGSAYWLKTYGWFGTTAGRIFRSNDMGNSWKVSVVPKAAIVYQILFKDVNNGIAIYAETSDRYAPRIVAATNDGGITWYGNRFNFGSNSLNPVYIYSADETNQILLLCSSGQVFGTIDNGTTWNSVLSSFHGNIQIGAGAFWGKNKIRLWDFSDKIGYLDFNIVPKFIDKELDLLSDNFIKYDSVETGLSRTKNLSINNTGNYYVTTSYNIEPGNGTQTDEFKIITNLSDTLDTDKSAVIRVKFSPQSIGDKQAVLTIKSDAKQGDFKIDLTGVGVQGVSVRENNREFTDNTYKLIPNPSSGLTKLEYNVPDSRFLEIFITDLTGNKVMQVYSGFITQGVNSGEFDVRSIPTGVYFVNIKSGTEIEKLKLIVK